MHGLPLFAGSDQMGFLEQLGLTIPVIQAPMAGISTPAMAAAVSNAGGLGSIGVGATDAAGACAMIAATRALTGRAFNVNLFLHAARSVTQAAKQRGWNGCGLYLRLTALNRPQC